MDAVHAELPQLLLIVLGTILGPAVGVVDRAPGWAFGADGLHERTPHQVRRHPGAHRMPDHLTGVQILDAGEIQPAFRGRHVGDVGDPGLVRSCRDKRLGQEILRHRQGMIRLRGRREPPNLCAAQPQLLAQPLDAPDPSGEPVVTQFRLEALRAVRLPRAHMRRLDRHFQPRVLLGAFRRTPVLPGIVAASRHLQHPAQQASG